MYSAFSLLFDHPLAQGKKMVGPIPAFDHNFVLPPHLGNPVFANQVSPYPCTTIDLCKHFGTTKERRKILSGLLSFRNHLRSAGLTTGFQWLDGSFIENIEARDNRPPNDIDVVTFYWGYDLEFQQGILEKFPEIANPKLSKLNFLVDHYPVDADYNPAATIEATRYWIQLFSHNRLGVWKGIVQIDLDTQAEDHEASEQLARYKL